MSRDSREMERLSPEVVHEILHYLPSRLDLSNFRLVQNSFARIVMECLFRTVKIEPSHRGLSRFLGLSCQADLARHVKEVVMIVGDLLSKPLMEKLELGYTEPGDPAQETRFTTLLRTALHEVNEFYTSADFIALIRV